MGASEVRGSQPPERARPPRSIAPISLAALFLLVHVAAPWGLSLLSTRHGWANRRPGRWNLLALILVVPGIAGTLWMVSLHVRASARTFLWLRPAQKLLTPGPYSFSRNPMYLLELSFWLGWGLFYGSLPVLLGFLLWLVMFNFLIVPYEERYLETRFGEAYRQYKEMVPRWLASPRRWQDDT